MMCYGELGFSSFLYRCWCYDVLCCCVCSSSYFRLFLCLLAVLLDGGMIRRPATATPAPCTWYLANLVVVFGGIVLAALSLIANVFYADFCQFCFVLVYVTANCRLHFHSVFFMRRLPTSCTDFTFARLLRTCRES